MGVDKKCRVGDERNFLSQPDRQSPSWWSAAVRLRLTTAAKPTGPSFFASGRTWNFLAKIYPDWQDTIASIPTCLNAVNLRQNRSDREKTAEVVKNPCKQPGTSLNDGPHLSGQTGCRGVTHRWYESAMESPVVLERNGFLVDSFIPANNPSRNLDKPHSDDQSWEDF